MLGAPLVGLFRDAQVRGVGSAEAGAIIGKDAESPNSP
jgi:hypothetical protein